jgi:hypothetical protein
MVLPCLSYYYRRMNNFYPAINLKLYQRKEKEKEKKKETAVPVEPAFMWRFG